MNCNCTNGCNRCSQEPVIREVFSCPGSQRVVRHEHIVRHRHDTIHEYDVIHEHEFNTHDVVREREVVRHNDNRRHEPNYCGEGCGPQRPIRPRFWSGRRW